MPELQIYMQEHYIIAYYAMVAIMIVPVARIFMRAGYPAWYAAFLAVPMAGVALAAGWLAIRPWPALTKKDSGA